MGHSFSLRTALALAAGLVVLIGVIVELNGSLMRNISIPPHPGFTIQHNQATSPAPPASRPD